MARSLLLEDALESLDRVALAVEQPADALEQGDVVGPVIAPAAGLIKMSGEQAAIVAMTTALAGPAARATSVAATATLTVVAATTGAMSSPHVRFGPMSLVRAGQVSLTGRKARPQCHAGSLVSGIGNFRSKVHSMRSGQLVVRRNARLPGTLVFGSPKAAMTSVNKEPTGLFGLRVLSQRSRIFLRRTAAKVTAAREGLSAAKVTAGKADLSGAKSGAASRAAPTLPAKGASVGKAGKAVSTGAPASNAARRVGPLAGRRAHREPLAVRRERGPVQDRSVR